MGKVLLVGLDNPRSDDPSNALFPLPKESSGGRLVSLIQERESWYTARHYLRDYFRTNLYPTRRAPEGKGTIKADRDAFAFLRHYVEVLDAEDIVLFGSRTVAAFNSLYDEDLDWCGSRVINEGRIRRFWALPHPSGRNRWYNDSDNREAASKLLAYLSTSASLSAPVREFDEYAGIMP